MKKSLVMMAIFCGFMCLGMNSFSIAQEKKVAEKKAEEKKYDIVIYGGTSAGVVAAIQASRMKHSVVLIEPSKHIGGLTTGGLGWTDSGNKAVIGGISREFYQHVKKHYDQPSAWKFQKAEQYSRYRPSEDAMWTFAPSVAENIYHEMLKEHNIPVVMETKLNRKSGVKMDGQKIQSITMLNGDVYSGKMFIDGTYEGDLLAAANVSFTVGRESNDKYGENLNGVQTLKNNHSHRFIKPVDPYVTPGKPESGVLPKIQTDGPGVEGEGDHRVQAYCFRMCMSRVAENRVPFPKPENYNEADYELLFRNFEAGDHRLPLKIDMMPNGKTDTNNQGAFSTDNLGMNYKYPEASYEEREKIIQEHQDYQQGLMWSLANHPRVPEKVRQQMSIWGLAKDEFLDSGHWPHQLYIREARRMVSDYVMTEKDCKRQRIAEDSVGLGSYNMDSHNTQRYITKDGTVQNEGDIQVSPGGSYLISYRSIVPKKGEAENLLVPAAMSASHMAYGSIRMEPVFMILGQSAATAAVHAIQDKITVQEVDYKKLRERLLADKQALDLPSNSKPKQVLSLDKLPGVVVDDSQAKRTGNWSGSTSMPSYIESGYRHDDNQNKGKATARFESKLPTGKYEVRVAYGSHENRAKNVPVSIKHANGSHTASIDQTKPPKIQNLFISLGEFEFTAEQPAVVEISNEGTNGYVIIDAVQFLKVEK